MTENAEIHTLLPDEITWGAGPLAVMARMSAFYMAKRRKKEAKTKALQAQDSPKPPPTSTPPKPCALRTTG